MANKWCVVFIVCFSLAPWAISQKVTPVDSSVENTAQQLTHALLQQGFQVGRGYPKMWAIEDCDYVISKVGSCFANNPAAPYVVAAVPPWPGEYVDEDSVIFGRSHDHMIDIHRFDQREAVIILAQMPPPARYFSEATYIWTQQGSFDKGSDTYQAIDSDPYLHGLIPLFFMKDPNHRVDPGRIFAFASLSNPINNVVIGNNAFGKPRFFVITPDAFMDNAVREAFKSIRIDEEDDVFTERIPSNLALGLDFSSDDFMTGLRYAQPDDGGTTGTPSDVWRKQLPIAVLRVRDLRHTAQPFGAFTEADLETRTVFDEAKYKTDLLNLASAVSNNWGQSGAVPVWFHDLQSGPAHMVGPACVPIGQDCLGDNWDASYQLYSPGAHSLDNGEVYAVVGTLGTETGNATYVGLSINDMGNGKGFPILKGVGNVSDSVLKDTAKPYASALTNPDKLFYVYYFTMDCSGLEQFTDGHCLSLKDLMPVGNYPGFGVRDYVVPGTRRGPDSAYVLPAILIKLFRP